MLWERLHCAQGYIEILKVNRSIKVEVIACVGASDMEEHDAGVSNALFAVTVEVF